MLILFKIYFLESSGWSELSKSVVSIRSLVFSFFLFLSLLVQAQWKITDFHIPEDLKGIGNPKVFKCTRDFVILYIKRKEHYLLKYNLSNPNADPLRIVLSKQKVRCIRITPSSINNKGEGYIYCYDKKQNVICYKINSQFQIDHWQLSHDNFKSQFSYKTKNSLLGMNKNLDHIRIIVDGQDTVYKLGSGFNSPPHKKATLDGNIVAFQDAKKIWYKLKNQQPQQIEVPDKYKRYRIQ